MQLVNRALARNMSKVRLVGEGKNDIVNIAEALSLAEESGLDLILVSDKSTPPVVKISDYKKIQYEEKKARAKQSKSGGDQKEIRLKVNISEHDLTTKISAINRFLERGDKVKLVVRLAGRERENPERATQLIERVCSLIVCKTTKVPGQFGVALLEPAK